MYTNHIDPDLHAKTMNDLRQNQAILPIQTQANMVSRSHQNNLKSAGIVSERKHRGNESQQKLKIDYDDGEYFVPNSI